MIELEKPFKELYAFKSGKKKRIYSALGVARAQVTRALDSNTAQGVFAADVELWAVGDNGWTLLFHGRAGDSHEIIPWKTAIQANTRQKELAESRAIHEEEKAAREVYERLRKRFEG